MVRIDSLDCLVLFDQRMGLILKVFPKRGITGRYGPPPGSNPSSWKAGQVHQTMLAGAVNGIIVVLYAVNAACVVVFDVITNQIFQWPLICQQC